VAHFHDTERCTSAVWHPEKRCTRTAHRIATLGCVPRQTRELPVILWPFELSSRIEARIRGRLHRTGRLPL
jgi:hypothetical protein